MPNLLNGWIKQVSRGDRVVDDDYFNGLMKRMIKRDMEKEIMWWQVYGATFDPVCTVVIEDRVAAPLALHYEGGLVEYPYSGGWLSFERLYEVVDCSNA